MRINDLDRGTTVLAGDDFVTLPVGGLGKQRPRRTLFRDEQLKLRPLPMHGGVPDPKDRPLPANAWPSAANY